MTEDTQNHEMSFLDHLEELRWHIIRSAFAVVIFASLAFLFKNIIFDIIIIGPSKPGFFTNYWLCYLGEHSFLHTSNLCINSSPIKLQNLQMSGQFSAHIKISIITGFILAAPYVFYELWRFISPALHTKEKNIAKGAVFGISILFFAGVVFGYYVICPLSINFLINYHVSEQVANIIQLMSYVSLVSNICLASGLLFEMPILIMVLTKIGLITPNFLIKYRRHAIIGILIIAAILTPPDIFSQILVSLPLLLLYEISIIISKNIVKKKKAELL